jgi:hypothetical protein
MLLMEARNGLFKADGNQKPYDNRCDMYEKFSPTGSGMMGRMDVKHLASQDST